MIEAAVTAVTADEQDPGEDLGGGQYASDCRARVAFDVLSNRWDSVIVYILGESGPMRPRALLARIGGISPKVLNEALRRLEYNGLVVRQAYAEAPPRVDYSLTEAGTALLVPIRAMGAWAGRYTEAVLAAQDRFTSP
ncbi:MULTISPECIES: helix-turn-helix domain-containing protein [Streptomyces]|uniref:Transcriptional regulator n=1 Tax=Streptomyces venezuelae TaxID=54571 RepID=A0A5P2B6L8_STRVZ|nr:MULTISPECIES: helix-turn-helix domain-containing protein [Streptomyces]NDZ97782.1 helix-turn-helix transcriptional regulator [Streptomyces sp. SID10116]MYY80566.1 transcriptional regulator [Streptomyces sp. SID335]MYZ15254.1 transcriptional regulator [Streptomyces sp. SID337]NDZ87771.1 helix-turn-helix transcriptional regulator [Streptomyces sp. SID10115]NEB43275.1 helix-turn-helix transcriptional regulator [Streptomyces sp. SID339]